MTDYIKPKEVAKRLGVSVTTVHARIESGIIPARDIRKPGGKRALYIIDPDELDECLKGCEVSPKPRQAAEHAATVRRAKRGMKTNLPFNRT